MKSTIQKSILFLTFAIATVFAATPKTPLSIWVMPNGASPKEKLDQTLIEFTKQTGYPVEVKVLDWGEAWNRISSSLRSGQNLPDVMQLGTTWIPYFSSRGEIKPLNNVLKQFQPKRFVPVSWYTTHIDSDTTIYSIPWFIDIRPVLGNKRILKKNGITADSIATYEGFKKTIRAINAAKETLDDGVKVKAYSFPGKRDWNIPHNFAPWIWSNGGDFIKKNDEGKWQANILDKQTLLGIERYLTFILDTLVSPEALQTNTNQIVQQFNNGELAFIINTAEVVMQTRINDDQGGLMDSRIGSDSVDIFPIPLGEQGSVSFIGGSNLAIPARNNRPEAIKLLQFLTQDKNLDAYTKQIGLLPPSMNVLSSWSEDEVYKKLIKALETGKTYTTIPEWGDIEQILVAMFCAVWDHLEIPALYSEEKLYNIFLDYSQLIDQRLDVQNPNVMTFEEFLQNWHPRKKVVRSEEPEEQEEVTAQTHIKNNLRIAPWLFIFIFILGFAFSYKRKRKK